MRPLLALLLVVLAAAALIPAAGAQSPEPAVAIEPSSARMGDHLRLTVRLQLPAGQSPELIPATEGWGEFALVALEPPRLVSPPGQDPATWELTATVAAFALGRQSLVPTVAVTSGSDVTALEAPPAAANILPTLPPDAPLELTPLPPPAAIPGAASPFLVPAVAAAVVAALALTLAALALVVRRLRSRPATGPGTLPEPALAPDPLPPDEALAADPVSAYRAIAAAVRADLASRFGLPATALTATELRARLEAAGVDRWLARLAGGLLEECDAVVYAGYRPAHERRLADLALAREILGGHA
ncbi:hypothetical protein [Tepidiforma sp.]|uniref:hypothetical protein n=1 Tax=Tepidiforma sp. TaxID=2682230 RepID=UPI002ADD83B7|nr:hypothetical protein [Tepidiforma sp.]